MEILFPVVVLQNKPFNAGRTELKKAFVDGTRQISPARKLNSNNKTGVKGVCWSSRKQKYRAQIAFKAKVYHLGFYDKLEDAAKARKQAEENMFDTFVAEQQDLVAQVSLESTVKLLLIVELNRAEQERLTLSKRTKDGTAASDKKPEEPLAILIR